MGLTKRTVDAALATPPASGERTIWDGDLPGFGLRVRPSGAGAYVLVYRVRGRSRRMVLGSARVLTPDEARRLARRALAEVAAGDDPLAARRAARKSGQRITFADVVERWREEHAAQRLKPASRRRAEGLLRHHILPALGRVRIEDVEREHVARLVHSMRARPTSANRARALVSAILHFAERAGLRPPSSNPCRAVEPFPERRRRRFLDGEELARVGRALEEMERIRFGPCDVQAVAAIRLLLLTGARAGEILGARWEHVDWERGVLRLPDSKTGAKELVLGSAARAVLAELRERDPSGEGFVIPGREPGKPLVGLFRIWKRALRLAGIDETMRLHDLRRTAASAGASAGLTLEQVGQLLGHRQVATTRSYAFLWDEVRREAAERLERPLVEALRAEPRVVPLRRG